MNNLNPIEEFKRDCDNEIVSMSLDDKLKELSINWMASTAKHKYTYHFTWMGRPIIQYPQDLLALQEIIWQIKPEVIIETGIAHGGSLIFYASMLELIAHGEVIGIDLDIREHNRVEIEKHVMFKRITMLEGSSTDAEIVQEVKRLCSDKKCVMVVLDSNHTHSHVLEELKLYSPLVTAGSYLIVMDTGVDDMPEQLYAERPWGKGNNPKTAVKEFLRTTDRFIIDEKIHSKLLITVAPDGYLKCIE
ncbi:MAG TPA: cephalosporin hydroxylase family protein [Desulfosporosinus sp.]|nr:cephalosporin hydroxylase family protein [Desulfosporosinus sp.]